MAAQLSLRLDLANLGQYVVHRAFDQELLLADHEPQRVRES